MAILNSYAKLRELLFQIEVDLGIEELTETERKVLAAIARLSGGTNCNVRELFYLKQLVTLQLGL